MTHIGQFSEEKLIMLCLKEDSDEVNEALNLLQTMTLDDIWKLRKAAQVLKLLCWDVIQEKLGGTALEPEQTPQPCTCTVCHQYTPDIRFHRCTDHLPQPPLSGDVERARDSAARRRPTPPQVT